MLIWIVLIGCFILIEFFTVQLIALPFVFGGIAGFISSFYTNDLVVQLLIFVVVSIISLFLLQLYLRKKIQPKPFSTNLDLLVGKELIVESFDCLRKRGTAKINGVNWTIQCEENCEINDRVYIKEIKGTTLLVEKEK